MARGEFRGPDLVVSAARIRVLPSIADVERTADDPCTHFLTEEPLQQVFVKRKGVLREDRVSELLELVQDVMVQARIVMVSTSQHDDADAVLALKLIEDLACAPANVGLVVLKRLESGFDCAVVFFF